jgi:hypothetical protein
MEKVNKRTDKQMEEEKMDGLIKGQADGQMDRWTDGQMDRT